MKKGTKKILAMILSVAMVFSTSVFAPADFQKTVLADVNESLVTDFSYDFAYTTPGYADGTIRISANEDGVYKIFWGDAEGNKLKKNGYEYSYLARVIVKDGKGSFNIISDYTAIPENAKTVLVYRKDAKQYVYDIPADKLFAPEGDSYTFGALSDLHYGRYSTLYDDDAVPAVDNALDFLDNVGVKFVGISGDLTAGGEQTSLDKYNTALAKHPDITALICTGNHDSRTTISTTDTSALDTSIIRWYNSIASGYYTVDADGIVTNKLNGYPILANDALTNPISTQYRAAAQSDAEDTTVPGLDFVTTAGGNIFIFFNEIAQTSETYKVDDLITTGQMDWLAEQLETYKDKKVFIFFHSYLPVNTLNNDAVDYSNCTGDLKSDGGYSYNLDFKDAVTTSDGLNMQALFNKYSNVTMFSGHSHWQYAMQELNANLNIGRLKNGNGATLVHLSSVTEPRYVGRTDSARTELNGEASEGSTVTTYDDCTVYNSIDFYNGQYEAYATYIIPAGTDSKYEPVKNPSYKESADAITGDEYLEAEDMTSNQLLKSDYNLMLGAGYVYSSKGSENTDGTLTDGSAVGNFLNTKEGKKADQYVIVTLDGEQEVSNLKNFMLYFVNGLTDCSSFNIQLSLDGENYETVGTYTDMKYTTTTLDVDISNLTLTKYKYVKLNLTGGSKTYGYQIKEFAAIGYERNATPNTAGSSSSLVPGNIDEEDYLATDYNLIYGADYTQSSVGGENSEGKLTDGKITGGFVNTERDSSAQNQEFVIDLGKANIQNVSNIDYFLLYFQNELTNATDFNVSVSLDGKTYEQVGTYSNVNVETNHFDPDLSGVTLEQFRYVKLNLTAGKTGYGYQVKEFAVIGINPIQYPEIADQTANVASAAKNYALNKTIYVSSTYAKEGSDPNVLTDGKKDKYWSSDWDNTRTSEYIIIDLGDEYDTEQIGTVLVNYKSNDTFCGDYKIEFSKTYNEEDPSEGFYEVAKTKAASWEIMQKYSDANGYVATQVTDVDSDTVRYVKINMNGHKGYGYQIYEVAVIAREIPPKNLGTDSKAKISIADQEYVYTGSVIEPQITVLYGEKTLDKDTDYTVAYTDNVNAGTAKYTVTGIGDYTGTAQGEFTIAPHNLNSNDIAIDDSGLKEDSEFDGNEKTPVITLKYNEEELTEGKDFTVAYEDNLYPGTATVTIKGIGNYTGEIVRTFNIVKKSMENVTVTTSFDDDNQLVITVENNGYEMIEGQDYTYIADTDELGNITITFTAMGDNYSGTFVKKISAVDNPNRPKVEISESKEGQTYKYTGSEIRPDVDVRFSGNTLVQDTDYTVSYEDNINAGTAKVKVVGIGKYEGVINDVYNFEIGQKDLSDSDVVADESNLKTALEFNGKDRTPIVILSFNGKQLNVNADYTTKYENNFYPGTATVTIIGIGNFKGQIVKKFTIIKKPIGNVTIRTSFDAAKQLVITVNNGSYKMTKDKDYTYTVVTDAEGNITITFTGLAPNYSGTYVKKIAAADNPNRPVPPTVKKTKIKKVKNTKGKKVKLSWKKISGASGYQIKYSTTKKFKKKKTKTKTIKKNTAKYTIKKLKKKTKYYIKVRAYKVYNGKPYYGKWSKKKSVTINK